MAEIDPIKRYFEIVSRIKNGQRPSKEDLEYFLSYTPSVDEAKLKKLVEGGDFTSTEEARNAVVEVGRILQTSPEYKQDLLDLSQANEAGKISDKLSQGINLVLGGVDIANSINQINASNQASKRSRRPSRPGTPGRDQLLVQALRQSQEGQFDSERALAPARAEIQDQYLSDIQGAKTASTGQAGSYGVYRQVAANRRNRAALQLAPIADDIKRGQEARYDNLLGMRQAETQRMFENQASLYPYDLRQYNLEQDAAARVGQAGRLNLRDSLYNVGSQFAGSIGNNVAQSRYNQLRNKASAAGLPEDVVVGADQRLRGYLSGMTSDDTPNYWAQMY